MNAVSAKIRMIRAIGDIITEVFAKPLPLTGETEAFLRVMTPSTKPAMASEAAIKFSAYTGKNSTNCVFSVCDTSEVAS